MSELIRDKFEAAQVEVREYLRPNAMLSDAERRQILRRYCAAISGHFVNWMAAASVCCRSLEARYAASENIYIELKDDHVGMLHQFVEGSKAEPDRADYSYVWPYVSNVQTEASKMSGLFLTTLLGILENTSLEFVPWLQEISTSLGNTNIRYAAAHGAADIEHANQFRWALEKEASYYENADEQIAKSIELALRFLKAILTPD